MFLESATHCSVFMLVATLPNGSAAALLAACSSSGYLMHHVPPSQNLAVDGRPTPWTRSHATLSSNLFVRSDDSANRDACQFAVSPWSLSGSARMLHPSALAAGALPFLHTIPAASDLLKHPPKAVCPIACELTAGPSTTFHVPRPTTSPLLGAPRAIPCYRALAAVYCTRSAQCDHLDPVFVTINTRIASADIVSVR